MPAIVYRTCQLLGYLVAALPIGTNLGIWRLLWTLLSGRLLHSRGALFPALMDAGLSEAEARQAEAALREGKLCVGLLTERLRRWIEQEGQWQERSIGGFRPFVIDWVGFFRPRLCGCLSRHFDSRAGKALPAIEFGLIVRIGHVLGKRIPQLVGLTRGGDTLSLVRGAGARMGPWDVLVGDRQVRIKHLAEAGVERFVVRAPVDFTARTKEPPPYCGRGRYPKHGAVVRPLPRTYRGRTIAATTPERTEQFVYQGRVLQARLWDNLVVADCPSLVFGCCVIEDPRYKQPWVLVSRLPQETKEPVSAETLWHLYKDRWPVEQVPLAAKQLLGGHRAFVHSETCRHRLPELCLLAGAMSLYLAATGEAVPTGFWDRVPAPTPGRFRRALAKERLPGMVDLATLPSFSRRVRKKASVYGHLPVGIEAHRRQKRAGTGYDTVSLTGK